MSIGSILRRTLLFAALWWVVAEGRADSWQVGWPAVVLALIASLALSRPAPLRLSPAGLAAFVAFFLVQSVLAGIQVARIAVRARLDLRPAILEIPTGLPDPRARVLLAATLSLLPGTLSVALAGDSLRLHVLDSRLGAEAEVGKVKARIVRLLKLDGEET